MSISRPFYYLENFAVALAWLQERYGDLLSHTEMSFIRGFSSLPRDSRALLVRMIGRTGDVFRTAKLNYVEIGCPKRAAGALIEAGWIDQDPNLTLPELARLLKKRELQQAFRISGAALRAKKSDLLHSIGDDTGPGQRLHAWWPAMPGSERIFRLRVRALCDGLRLIFFGNFRQDWSQFVLTDLGIFKYEKVASGIYGRAFHTRAHIDTFHVLYTCRRLLEQTAQVEEILQRFPPCIVDNEWLESCRARVLFQIAQYCERQQDLPRAVSLYRDCQYPGSRLRVIRLLERLERISEAGTLAAEVDKHPADEIEKQQLGRMWPRLLRKAGMTVPRSHLIRSWPTFEITIPIGDGQLSVEEATAKALAQPDAPIHYVENGLINSLFGLLCWDAIFAPIPGAFFHQFQAAPADLDAPYFHSRRSEPFARCFAQLRDDSYRQTILNNFELKNGIQSPFVFWGLLTSQLLELALSCLPMTHLKLYFERLLLDIRSNRCGLPDLVQFWPHEGRYRLIEVKGPGDRLQDNQIRWLRFCARHDISVAVCHVRWSGEAD
jgi:hypothetical protein